MSKEIKRIINELIDRYDYTEIDDIVEDLERENILLQQQAKELERYKKFVKSIEIDEEHNLTILNETELKKLVGGNDE